MSTDKVEEAPSPTDEASTKPTIIFSVNELLGSNGEVRNPGIFGKIKQKPEHFQVTEIPLFPANGEGNNLMVKVRREGMNTYDVGKMLAKLFGVIPTDVGYAGLKDKVALVEQTFSVRIQSAEFTEEKFDRIKKEAEAAGLLISLSEDSFQSSLNFKKIRRGQLRGNKFKILLTELKASDTESVLSLGEIAILLQTKFDQIDSVPNYYGEQRVGKYGKHAKEGLKKLKTVQEYVDECGPTVSKSGLRSWLRKRKKNGNKKVFMFDSFGFAQKVNACQAALFNSELSLRIGNKTFNSDATPLVGDIVMSQYGGKTTVHKFDEVEVEDTDKSKTNPLTFALNLIGPRVKITPAEEEMLAAASISVPAFKVVGLDGGFRPAKLKCSTLNFSITVDDSNQGLWLEFQLPKGSFATNVIRELVCIPDEVEYKE